MAKAVTVEFAFEIGDLVYLRQDVAQAATKDKYGLHRRPMPLVVVARLSDEAFSATRLSYGLRLYSENKEGLTASYVAHSASELILASEVTIAEPKDE